MSLNNEHMLPAKCRSMRQMNELLDSEDIILAEIERIIDEMYERASMLHEELVNEAWIEKKLTEMTSAGVEVTAFAEELMVRIIFDVSQIYSIYVPDARKFLDKWLPAHLMYKIVLLLNYSTEYTEEFIINSMKMELDSFNWKAMTLNGTWLLDGTYNLDAIRKPDDCGLVYDFGSVESTENWVTNTILLVLTKLEESLDNHVVVINQDSFFWKSRTLNGTWLLDGSLFLDELRKPEEIGQTFKVGNTELQENYLLNIGIATEITLDESYMHTAVINQDSFFWESRTLDGTWLLDGSQLLEELRQRNEFGSIYDVGAAKITETMPSGVVIKRDLWLLDGKYNLNGTKILDAIRREEDL